MLRVGASEDLYASATRGKMFSLFPDGRLEYSKSFGGSVVSAFGGFGRSSRMGTVERLIDPWQRGVQGRAQ